MFLFVNQYFDVALLCITCCRLKFMHTVKAEYKGMQSKTKSTKLDLSMIILQKK